MPSAPAFDTAAASRGTATMGASTIGCSIPSSSHTGVGIGSPLGRRVIRVGHRPGGPPVPAVEVREVARVPGFAQPGGAQIPVRADLAGGGAQVTPQLVERRTAPEPVAVVDAVNDQSR